MEFSGPGHSTTGVETCQTRVTRPKNLLLPAPQKFNTFNTFNTFAKFANFTSESSGWVQRPPRPELARA